MDKTLSIRIGNEDYEFVKKMAKENKAEISGVVRELVDLGRLMYAIGNYKKRKLSIGKAAEIANLSVGEMIEALSEFGVKSNVGYDDYMDSLGNIRKAW